MHKLEVTLKQHTPLIHFQHDQEGATLRASEVKPKLDRFILTKLGENKANFQGEDKIEYDKTLQKILEKDPHITELSDYQSGIIFAKNRGWLVGTGEHGALDYKLKIVITQDPKIINIKKFDKKGKELPYPLFFGNIKKNPNNPDEYRKFSFLEKPFKIIFLCTDENILEEVERKIADFLLLNNFGTRQSKGFGSFFLDTSEKNKSYYKKPQYQYSFSVKINNTLPLDDTFVALYDTIDLFYKSLRSGINISWGNNPFYMKPMIFKYAKSNKLQWDKKSIKETYYPQELKNQQEEHDNPEILTYTQDDSQKYLFKDLLGLSLLEDWKKPYEKKITKVNSEIDRFRSPIIFKPLRIGDSFFVNLILEQIPQMFLGQDFIIESNGNGNLSLNTYPNFNIEDFLTFILRGNLESMLEYKEDIEHLNFKILRKIYSELKNNNHE